MSAEKWWLYLVRCRHGSLYAGISTDVERRFAEHASGGPRASRYLRGRGPLSLVYRMELGDRSLAQRLERRVKGMAAAEKEALIAGQLDLNNLFRGSLDQEN